MSIKLCSGAGLCLAAARYKFLIFALLAGFITHAPAGNLDSLITQLKKSKSDSTRVTRLLDVAAEHYQLHNLDSALKYNGKALDIASNVNYILELARSYNLSGLIYSRQRNFSKAAVYYLKAVDIARTIKNSEQESGSLQNIALDYLRQSDYGKSLAYYQKALNISEAAGDQKEVADILFMIGNMYSDIQSYQKAKDYYFKSFKIFESLHDEKGMADAYNNLAIAASQLHDNRGAMSYYQKVIELAKKINNLPLKVYALCNMAAVQQSMGDYEASFASSKEAEELATRLGDKNILSVILNNIASIYHIKKKYPLAESYYLRSIALAKEVGGTECIMVGQDSLSSLYFQTGNYKKAYDYLSFYRQARDSLFTVEKEQDLTRKEMNYEFEKKEAIAKAAHEKEMAIAEADKKRERLFSWFIIVLAFSIAIVALFIFRSLRLAKKQKVTIEEQKHLVEEHQKEIIDSITYAKRIQDAILPPLELIKQKLPESFVLYKPKDIVAGDFYWLEEFDGIIFIAAADCTGHGVPGAMVSMVCSNALTRAVKEFGLRDTGKILDKVTELVLETFEKSADEVKDGMDISLLAIDHKNKKISWSGANNPLWYISSGESKDSVSSSEVRYLSDENIFSITEVKADKQPVGKNEHQKPFATRVIDYREGTSFYLFTDGFADQFGGPAGKKFKHRQFSDLLLKIVSLIPAEQKQQIKTAFLNWKNNLEQVDDVCIIGIKI